MSSEHGGKRDATREEAKQSRSRRWARSGPLAVRPCRPHPGIVSARSLRLRSCTSALELSTGALIDDPGSRVVAPGGADRARSMEHACLPPPLAPFSREVHVDACDATLKRPSGLQDRGDVGGEAFAAFDAGVRMDLDLHVDVLGARWLRRGKARRKGRYCRDSIAAARPPISHDAEPEALADTSDGVGAEAAALAGVPPADEQGGRAHPCEPRVARGERDLRSSPSPHRRAIRAAGRPKHEAGSAERRQSLGRCGGRARSPGRGLVPRGCGRAPVVVRSGGAVHDERSVR